MLDSAVNLQQGSCHISNLICVTTLPCEIQQINNSNSLDVFNLITLAYVCVLNDRTHAETFVLQTHYIIDDTLSQAMPDLRLTLLHLTNVMNLTSVANVSVHTSMPKEDIIAFNVTQEYTNN